MKRVIFILLLLLTHVASATVDFIPAQFSRNEFFVGGSLANLKFLQLYKLTDEISKNMFKDSTYVRVYFQIDSAFIGKQLIPLKPKYCLSYTKCLFQNFAGEDSMLYSFSPHSSITLYCNTQDINVDECVKLIYYGLKQNQEIQQKQHLLLAKTALQYSGLNKLYGVNIYSKNTDVQFEFMYSIPQSDINRIISMEIPELNPYINQKAYRRWTTSEPASFGKIDYYIQNNKYVIYKVTGDNNVWCKNCLDNWEERIKDTLGIPVFSLNYIADIIGDGEENYIISTGDSFYHYIVSPNKLMGPYFLPIIKMPNGSFTSFPEKLTYSNDTFTIHASMWPLGDYDIKYVWSSHCAFIDSSSIDPNLKFYLTRMKDEVRVEDSIHRQKVALIKNIVQKQKSKQYKMLALAVIVLFVNAFLIWRARK